jgi:hypothetical protein
MMQMEQQSVKQLAQSASALGAGILGFGLGAKWGSILQGYSLIPILIGAVFHVYGMYITQMKQPSQRTSSIAKTLWVSAWICLVVLVAVLIYLFVKLP